MVVAIAIPNYFTYHFITFIQHCHTLHQKRHQANNATSEDACDFWHSWHKFNPDVSSSQGIICHWVKNTVPVSGSVGLTYSKVNQFCMMTQISRKHDRHQLTGELVLQALILDWSIICSFASRCVHFTVPQNTDTIATLIIKKLNDLKDVLYFTNWALRFWAAGQLFIWKNVTSW